MNDYISTETHQSVSSKQAILNGMSPDGGLYVLPTLDQIHLDLSLICTMSYKRKCSLYSFTSSYRLYKGRIKRHVLKMHIRIHSLNKKLHLLKK